MKPNIGQGDDGKTYLLGAKERCYKDDPQVEAYGTLDELNSIVGIIRACLPDTQAQNLSQDVVDILVRVQEDLFCAEAHVSAGQGYEHYLKQLPFDETRVQFLEQCIQQWEKDLPTLANFILPGGTQSAAFCDLARTVSRRAERRLTAFQRNAAQTPDQHFAYQYVNRLADFFFTLERYLNAQAHEAEKPWKTKR